jgi:glucosamine-6-phosphate deaminase
LRGDAADPEEECRAFDRTVEQAGGLDLAILGLGMNGHLGFNEPPAAPDLPSRVVALTPESIAGSARYWGSDGEVPKRALTAGMAQILAAKAALLLVSGERKQSILRSTLEGAISPQVPSSYLQQAANVTVLADRDAARTLDVARE